MPRPHAVFEEQWTLREVGFQKLLFSMLQRVTTQTQTTCTWAKDLLLAVELHRKGLRNHRYERTTDAEQTKPFCALSLSLSDCICAFELKAGLWSNGVKCNCFGNSASRVFAMLTERRRAPSDDRTTSDDRATPSDAGINLFSCLPMHLLLPPPYF